MNERPKTLLITSTGLIGGYLYTIFNKKGYPTIGTYHSVKDSNSLYYVSITEKASLKRTFDKVTPDIVLLNAALTNVDYCEIHKDKAWQINVEGVDDVVELCRLYNSKLVFFSTDYIFDGENGPYSEEEIPRPICFYGKTKLEGENIVRTLEDYLIIRTTIVYGDEKQKKNFVIRLIDTLKKGEIVKVPYDQIGSPTYALNLSEVVEELVRRAKRGVYNIAGKDIMDRFSFALEICSEFGLNKDSVIPVETSMLNQIARRPLKAGLKTDKIINEAKREILGVKESLKMLKRTLDG